MNDDDEMVIADIRVGAARLMELSGAMYEAFIANDDVGLLSACDGVRNALCAIVANVTVLEENYARERDTIPAPERKD